MELPCADLLDFVSPIEFYTLPSLYLILDAKMLGILSISCLLSFELWIVIFSSEWLDCTSQSNSVQKASYNQLSVERISRSFCS